ncbi:thiamine biosynthesis protein ThiF [Chryseobacterium taklimakanense]|uniref:Thiamine biosynthesis protein ThiF n=1 Tax=Chryseobacterium taklimakanense TaxID=536441 RepID=A0A239WN44_9FLAO|nr:ThiF family adenylyltransferase [Chryseobacterium taklimakanense]SNV35343.1 thiamine biosynthesis protein ThiF [Chryseobacterium taklimakanense]
MLKVHNLKYDELIKECSSQFLTLNRDYKLSYPLSSEIEFLKGNNFVEIWKVETGLYDEENYKWLVEDLVLYIGFTSDFPNKVPKVFVDKNNLKNVGIIPHLTIKTLDICLFDNYVTTNKNNPTGIITETIDRTVETLIKGIKKENLDEFENEFTAYWVAENKIILKRAFFYIINEYPTDKNFLNALVYENGKIVNYIIFNSSENLISDYKQYLENNNISYQEVELFYLQEIPKIKYPPYEYTYKESLELLPQDKQAEFKAYFNKNDSQKIVLFSKTIKNKKILSGWLYKSFNKKDIKGFRPNKLNDFLIAFSNNFPEHKEIIRKFNVEDVSEERLNNRTAGELQVIRKHKFLIAGLGSVGSYLVSRLNSINFPNFTLIDYDALEVTNIGRQLLGFHDVNSYKTDCIAKFLTNKNPSQNIDILRSSFIDIFKHNSEIYNGQDFIFLCTGETNLELELLEELRNGNIKKPIFRIWLEPFLLGGHFIYMSPDNLFDADSLYTDNHKFKHSIIKNSEYENRRDLFIQKEIGCQSVFSPYSSSHLELFISAIYPEIFKIIQSSKNKSLVVSWTGDLDFAKTINIEVNDNLKSFEITKHLI